MINKKIRFLCLMTNFMALIIMNTKRTSALFCYECSGEKEIWKCNENEPVFCSEENVCETKESEVVTKGCGNKCTVSRGDAADSSKPCKYCNKDLCNESPLNSSKEQDFIHPPRHKAHSSDGTEYVLYPKHATFWGARLGCAKSGGILATIHHHNVQTFLNENFIINSHATSITEEFPPGAILDRSSMLDQAGAWVGLFRSHSADNSSVPWMWTDDGSFLWEKKNACKSHGVQLFQNWDGEEPSGGSQACGFISRERGGTWKSGSCGRTLPAYICKYPDVVTQSVVKDEISYTIKAATSSFAKKYLKCFGEEEQVLDEHISMPFMYMIETISSLASECNKITTEQAEKTPDECHFEKEFVICQRPLVTDCTTDSPVSVSRKLSITHGCGEYSKKVNKHKFTFPSTRPGNFGYSLEKCDDGRPQAVMFCKRWPLPHFTSLMPTHCEQNMADLLQEVVDESRSSTFPLEEVFRDLHTVSLLDDQLSPNNVSSISHIFTKLSTQESQVSQDALYNSIAAVSRLRRILDKWKQNNRSGVFAPHFDLTSLVTSLEKFAQHVILSSNETSHKFSAEGVDLEIVELDDSVLYSGKDLEYKTPDHNSLIRITPDIPLSRTLTTQKLRAVFTTYDSDDLFPTEEENAEAGSVISATVTDGEQTFSVPVQFSMRVERSSNISADKCIKKECRYYNHTENKWRSDGCRKKSERKEGYSDTVTSECDHTTSFAVVISQHVKPSYALDIISTIALSLCIICLFLTVFIFFAAPELRKVRSAFTHKNLCTCLALAYLIFLVGVEATSNRYACLSVAVLTHFFLLSSWGWMAVESITMYRMFVKTFERRFMPESTKVAIIVYAVAAAIVLVTISFSVLAHFQGWGDEKGCEDDGWSSYISEGYCWLRGRSLYYGFLLIVGLALVLNIILAGVIIKAITWGRKAVKCSREEPPLIHVMRGTLVAMLLGVAWILAVPLAVTDNPTVQEVFGYIFAVIIFVQGAFIFYFFCIRRKDVRESWTGALANLFHRRKPNEEEMYEPSSSRNFGMSSHPAAKVARTLTSSTASEMTRKTAVSRASSSVSPRKGQVLKSSAIPTLKAKEQHEMKAIEHSLDLVEFTGEEVFEN